MTILPEWKLLLVDDDEDDYVLTIHNLHQFQGRKVELDWASSYEEGVQRLGSDRYDAALIDYDLGPFTGIEFIREFYARAYPAPLILFTGRGSYEVDLEALQAGATLYLTKTEVNPLLLERSIRYAIERKQIETQLRLANQELVEERNRLRAVMEALPVGVAIVDEKGGNIRSNAAFEQIWGGNTPPADSVADYDAYKAWWVESGEPLRPEEWASARSVQRGERITGQYVEIQRFNGERATVINSAAPIYDFGGKVAGSAVAIMDVTERRRYEEKLRYLASFPEQNPNPITEVDLDGNVSYMNPSAQGLFPDLPELKTLHPWLAGWPEIIRHFENRPVAPFTREVIVAERSYHQTLIFVPGERLIRTYGADISDWARAEQALE